MGLPLEQVTFQLGDSHPAGRADRGRLRRTSPRSARRSRASARSCRSSLFKLARKACTARAFARATLRGRRVRATARCGCTADPATAVAADRRCWPARATTGSRRSTCCCPTCSSSGSTSRATHSAVFCEVRVDEEFGTVRVTRVVSAIAAGRIINAKTARSQVVGGVVWGISQALHEETHCRPPPGPLHEPQLRRVPRRGERRHPRHRRDLRATRTTGSSAGSAPRASARSASSGVAAAVCNAIYHATGRRVRSTPMTPDKVMSR